MAISNDKRQPLPPPEAAIEIQLADGEQFPTLADAQAVALPILAGLILTRLRAGTTLGEFVERDGQLTPVKPE